MACQAIHSWTISSLVCAFLDLSITYFLLCASTLAFFTSKFLSFFGLNLPCPCNGMFSDPNTRNCVQRFLIDSPIKKISSVQKSVKNKFPFDSILMNDHHQGRQLIAKLVEKRDRCEELVELEGGESSGSSFSDVKGQKKNELVRFGSLNSQFVAKGFDDSKGKGFSNQRPRPGSLRRRRGNRLIRRLSSQSYLGSSRIGQEIAQNEASSVSTYSEGDDSKHDNEARASNHSDEGLQHSFKWNDLMGESKNFARDESSASDAVVDNIQREIPSGQSDVNAVRVLEQALEEEHAARAAVYQELEKERSAAASAADEAMAMILRLQKEKASTEMEARQYQRMIEEKSAYDQEEMNILKEILLRREKEKHFLEKEVEAYRQLMAPEKEEFAEMPLQRPRMSFDSSDDPALMLQQISEYIDKKKMVKNMKNASEYDPLSVENCGRVLDFGDDHPSPSWYDIDNYLKREDDRRSLNIEKHHMPGPESIDKSKPDFQEKGLLSVEEHPLDSDVHGQISELDSGFPLSSRYQDQDSFDKTIVVDEELGKYDNAAKFQGMDVKSDSTCKNEISFPCDVAYLEKDGNDADQDGKNHFNSVVEREPTILDVHVIDPNSTSCSQGREKASKSVPRNPATDRFKKFGVQPKNSSLRNIDIINGTPGTSTRGFQPAIRRSMSDMRSVLDKSQGNTLISDMRRNSLSSVDYERIKLESEVGCLRERLKMVQEGRDKLSFSVEHRERENLHLQLLDDIARQLREIRHLTEPVKAVRQASLPPSSSKVGSKKRRCRSVSLGIHGSS